MKSTRCYLLSETDDLFQIYNDDNAIRTILDLFVNFLIIGLDGSKGFTLVESP